MSDIAKRLIATVSMGVITQGDNQERRIAKSQVMEAVRELDILTTQVSELQAEKEQAEAKLAELRMEVNTQKAEKEVYLNSRNALEKKLEKWREGLERIRDCDWVITLPDRMDAVRDIARDLLRED